MKKKFAFFAIFLAVLMVTYAATESVVYVTKTGKKYHNRDCRTLARSKNLTELTIEQAQAKGYEPCKVCNPVRVEKKGETK